LEFKECLSPDEEHRVYVYPKVINTDIQNHYSKYVIIHANDQTRRYEGNDNPAPLPCAEGIAGARVLYDVFVDLLS
jgi:hypothetical protein